MKLFKKIPAWLIGGLIGILYFLATYYIDIGRCQIYGGLRYCSGMTGLLFFILNFPATISTMILGGGGIYAVLIIDFILGSGIGYLLGFLFARKFN